MNIQHLLYLNNMENHIWFVLRGEESRWVMQRGLLVNAAETVIRMVNSIFHTSLVLYCKMVEHVSSVILFLQSSEL